MRATVRPRSRARVRKILGMLLEEDTVLPVCLCFESMGGQ